MMIYLDSASMHPALPCAVDAFRTAPFGNPSSEHAVGHAARDALEQARKKIAKSINAKPEEIIFTSGSTEACNLAASILSSNCRKVNCDPKEHHAVLEAFLHYSRVRDFYHCSYDMGYCVMLGNNETGGVVSFPLSLRHTDRLIFTDATAAMGHIPIDVSKLEVNYLSAGAHKFGGFPGAGFLYVKSGSPIAPMIRGGGQERGMRSGTENVPAICAMASALEWQTEHMEENTDKLLIMQGAMCGYLSEIPDIKWNTPFVQPRLPHILNVSFLGVDAHALALLLSKDGVMVSPGAACSNGLHEPSHVIMAMFHDEQRARSAIRISLSHENTLEECAIAAEKIKNAVSYLRSLT